MKTSSHMSVASFHSRGSSVPFSCCNRLKTKPLLILFPLSEAECVCMCVVGVGVGVVFYSFVHKSKEQSYLLWHLCLHFHSLCGEKYSCTQKKLEMDV